MRATLVEIIFSSSALWDEINNPVEFVTSPQFRETGEEVWTDDILLFDGIEPSDDIPNHLLLLYLNLGVFLLILGLLLFFKQFKVVIISLVLVIMGCLNIIFQVRKSHN